MADSKRPIDALNRPRLIIPAILGTIICALLFRFLPQALADKKSDHFALTILHTNDLHAHDQSFQDRGKIVGGMARLGHLIRELRKQNDHTVVADAGDIFQGTPYFTYYHGEIEIALLNMIGYDLYTIGNHEFDEGAINLAKQLSKAKFDVLNCNLNADALPELKKLLKPSVIKTINGQNGQNAQKVAFIGAITPDIETLSLTRNGVVLESPADWAAPVKAEVARLSAEGIDKIILVTHCGVEADKYLAAQIPQVDAIIGGHSHTRLDQPVVVDHADGSRTLIVQTGSYGRNLGKLDLIFDKGLVDLADSHYQLIHITDQIAEDKDIKDYLITKGEPLQTLKDTVLSYASHDFDNSFRSMKTDSALGDLICDSFYEAGLPDKAEITFENRGGIRSRIEKGSVNLEKVEELLPFENHLVFADVTGTRVRQTLEHSVAGATGGKFLDVHGLKFAYDGEKKPGQRIIFALANRGKSAQGWQEIIPDAKYRIGMTDYSFKGGEGYEFPDAENIKYTDLKLNAYLKSYLQAHPQIKPSYGDRIAYVSGSVIDAIGKSNFNNTVLQNCSGLKATAYTSDSLGVSTFFAGNNSAVLPLEAPQILFDSLSIKQLKSRLKQANNLKRYTAVVVSGDLKKPKKDNQTFETIKSVKSVSYPLSAVELKEALNQ